MFLSWSDQPLMGRGPQAAGFVQGLTNLIPQLGALTSILPPATLAWKLRLLAEGCRYMEGRCVTVAQCPILHFDEWFLCCREAALPQEVVFK